MSDGSRIAIDPQDAERGFATLVLTIVELLRQLMERQAIRRIDAGDLTDDQVERLGSTLMALDRHMRDLCEHFGITPGDLNIDLGPLGTLLPTDVDSGRGAAEGASAPSPAGSPSASPHVR